MDIPTYIEQIKKAYGITNDYALAKKLKVSQPEANWFRRGKKVPNATICIRIANLLKKNPVELLVVAQKDRAAPEEKGHWAMALSAVDVMMNVPQRPRYIPQKVEAIGQELRQLESQMLSYEGTIAQNEAIHLLKTVETSIDSLMERWQIWKRDGSLYPNYLLGNQVAVQRGVRIRRLFVFTREQMTKDSTIEDALQVLNDQRRAGVAVFFGFREQLAATLTYQRLVAEFRALGVKDEINAALFDDEILIFSRSYATKTLGSNSGGTPITLIDQLNISWKPDHLRALNPRPLFETRYVFDYRGERPFHTQLGRFLRTFTPGTT
jgi:transcriptional regulator with XRE-family HTH domain